MRNRLDVEHFTCCSLEMLTEYTALAGLNLSLLILSDVKAELFDPRKKSQVHLPLMAQALS